MFPRLLLHHAFLLSIVVFSENAHGQNTTTTTNETVTDDANSSAFFPTYPDYPTPPWGRSSFGVVGVDGSDYRVPGFGDIVRNGWSWTRREMRNSAPFCYDTLPGRLSSCYTGSVKEVCESSSFGGQAAYGDNFCLFGAAPVDVLGPVCWNGTCYSEEAQTACTEIGGSLFGDVGPASSFAEYDVNGNEIITETENAAWCAIPGTHTIVGPACYGEECFTSDLAAACTTLNGTNFADLFCVVDKSYTVIGPICTPVDGPIANASVCHPEETKDLCANMNGINIGDIFCVVNGDYSVLGPFCHTTQYDVDVNETGKIYAACPNATEAENACKKLGGSSVGEGMFCVLPGNDYHLLGPLCNADGGCWIYADTDSLGNSCSNDFGGTAIGGSICIIKGDYTIVGPSTYGDVSFRANVLAQNLDESDVFAPIQGVSSWYVINGTFSVFGPTCYGSSCFGGDHECLQAGGSSINSIFCVIEEGNTNAAGSAGSGSATTSPVYTASTGIVYMILVIIAVALPLLL